MDFSLGVQDCVRCSRADWGNASVVACLCGRRQLGPCLLWNREGSPAHRCGAVSLMNFTDMVRLLAEQPLRHYASLDCAVPRVGGGQDCKDAGELGLASGGAVGGGSAGGSGGGGGGNGSGGATVRGGDCSAATPLRLTRLRSSSSIAPTELDSDSESRGARTSPS